MARLVIVGGGFAGVWAALAAARVGRAHRGAQLDLQIILVTRDPWLTIRPRLYEASLEQTRVPLNAVLGPAGVDLVIGDVADIDVRSRAVLMKGAGGGRLSYDRLVLATGSAATRPPIPGAEHAFSVDTYAEALALQRHIGSLSRDWPTAVVVGAGFTGIEVATALASRMRVIVVERASVVAPDLGSDAREHVARAFRELGVESRTGVSVSEISPDGVWLTNGEIIRTATTVWTGGFRSSSLTSRLGGTVDEVGRIEVGPFLEVIGVDGVYAAGDAARAIADVRDGRSYIAPMSCQCAIPMGEAAGYNAAADLLGEDHRAFSHSDYVTCLDLGAAGALFMEGWDRTVRLTGFWGKLMKEMINTRLIYPPVIPSSPVIPSEARDLHFVGADLSLRPG